MGYLDEIREGREDRQEAKRRQADSLLQSWVDTIESVIKSRIEELDDRGIRSMDVLIMNVSYDAVFRIGLFDKKDFDELANYVRKAAKKDLFAPVFKMERLRIYDIKLELIRRFEQYGATSYNAEVVTVPKYEWPKDLFGYTKTQRKLKVVGTEDTIEVNLSW